MRLKGVQRQMQAKREACPNFEGSDFFNQEYKMYHESCEESLAAPV